MNDQAIRISSDHIGNALNEIRYPGSWANNDYLYDLRVIDQILSTNGTSTDILARKFTFEWLLVSIITERLNYQRRIFGLEVLDETETRVQACDAICIDGRQRFRELVTWSILYYLYVRVDLEFSLQELSDMLSYSPRTMRRYRTAGIQSLIQYLFWVEWHACSAKSTNLINDRSRMAGVPEYTSSPVLSERWWLLSLVRQVFESAR